MSNIVLTDVCNLACPYCFANEFVNHSANEISMENFNRAKAFILTGKNPVIGLIGGEPLLHTHFREILQNLIEDQRVAQAVIYTNGIHCDKFINEFSCEKFRFLINCNSPSDIGKKQYQRLLDNLHLMIRERYLKNRITLGINMYKPDFEYEYLLEILEMYQFKNVRVSITVPCSDNIREQNAFSDFMAIKPRMFEFFRVLQERGIAPHYDCNKIPGCCLTQEERDFSKTLFQAERDINRRNVDFVRCNPVIDILQDLTAIRCFGLSQSTKQSILDYQSIDELRAYYQRSVDSFAANTVHSAKCVQCAHRLTNKCYGGCLVYKTEAIQKLQDTCQELMQK